LKEKAYHCNANKVHFVKRSMVETKEKAMVETKEKEAAMLRGSVRPIECRLPRPA
jgi:hypothetical protein